MIINKRKYYLLNYIFILGIIMLFLNDHVFKWEFSNWFTGKLSDFVGLLVFPFFLTFLFPQTIRLNTVFIGLFFIFWKSPYSQEFIELYNSITFIKITRVVDYSDLIALSVLPLSYYFINNKQVLSRFYFRKIKIHPILVLLPSVIVFMASSPPYWHYFSLSEGNIKFFKNSVKVKKTKDEILNEIREQELNVVVDTSTHTNNSYISHYLIDELVLDNDTISNLRFSLVSFKGNTTKVFLKAITISDDLTKDEVDKELRKYYKKLLRKYVKGSLK